MIKQQSIGKEAAISLYETKWWEGKSSRDVAEFQILTAELCCPFDIFHEALESTLGRPIWTHEIGLNLNGIMAELFDGKAAPSFEEIINLIPEEKRLLVVVG